MPEVSAMGRRYAVLLTVHASEYVNKIHGGLGPLFVKLLGDPGETWDLFSVIDGVLPGDEELHKFDGFVVTGSWHDAHGSADWVQKLCQLIQKVHKKRKKLLGICFGHQVISRALGGTTGRAPAGWEIGVKKIDVLDALLSKPYGLKLPRTLSVIEAHQDQVFEMPPGGELLASSENTGIEMFAVEDHVLGIQGHPEFTEDILSNILELSSIQGIIAEELVYQARTSIKEGAPDREILQRLCKLFLKGCSHGPNNCNNDSVQGA